MHKKGAQLGMAPINGPVSGCIHTGVKKRHKTLYSQYSCLPNGKHHCSINCIVCVRLQTGGHILSMYVGIFNNEEANAL